MEKSRTFFGFPWEPGGPCGLDAANLLKTCLDFASWDHSCMLRTINGSTHFRHQTCWDSGKPWEVKPSDLVWIYEIISQLSSKLIFFFFLKISLGYFKKRCGFDDNIRSLALLGILVITNMRTEDKENLLTNDLEKNSEIIAAEVF